MLNRAGLNFVLRITNKEDSTDWMLIRKGDWGGGDWVLKKKKKPGSKQRELEAQQRGLQERWTQTAVSRFKIELLWKPQFKRREGNLCCHYAKPSHLPHDSLPLLLYKSGSLLKSITHLNHLLKPLSTFLTTHCKSAQRASSNRKLLAYTTHWDGVFPEQFDAEVWYLLAARLANILNFTLS